MYLLAGQDARFDLGGAVGTDYELLLYPPHAEDLSAPPVDLSVTPGTSHETIEYVAPTTGWYYVRVRRAVTSGAGGYYLYGVAEWPAPRASTDIERLWGSDRYTTAVTIAEENFPGWRNVNHVVIASGEDRAAADPPLGSGAIVRVWRADLPRPERLRAVPSDRGTARDQAGERAVLRAHRGRARLGGAWSACRHLDCVGGDL